KQLLGEQHPDLATSLNNLAALYDSQERYESADPLYQKALAILEATLGEDHPNTKACRDNLNYCMQKAEGRGQKSEGAKTIRFNPLRKLMNFFTR
ncbi:MAG: tetratricopeptide repeat protein, partial [Cyanobacteria bacterium J06621_8]